MQYLDAMFVPASEAVGETRDGRVLVRYHLANGLDVVLVTDRRVPKVALNLTFKVGSVNEPPGRSGFAHLFEHLMFSGTPAYPNIDETYSALGISANAFTTEDATVYHAEGLRGTLPVMLAVEADRMANQGAAITEEDLDLQRAVVLNEMRESVLDHPTGAGWEAMRAALFPPGHPYASSVIGSMTDLADARIADVHGFFDAYYAPNNAILVVAGDFEFEETRALIDETFGRVPPGPVLARVASATTAPTRRRLSFEDRTPTPVVVLGWSAPAFGATELGALRLAADILGDPDTGLLQKTLVDPGHAATVHAWHEPSYLASRFFVQATAANGTDPAALEAGLRAAVTDLVDFGIEPAELVRTRRRLLLNDRNGIESLGALAGQVALLTNMLDRPEAGLDDDPALLAATSSSVRQAVSRFLDPADATVMVIQPGERGGYPEVLTVSTGVAEPITATVRPPTEIPAPLVVTGNTAPPPPSQRLHLSNGIAVTHYPMPQAPAMHLAAISTVGALSAPPGKEGIVELAAMMAARGAGGRDRDALAKALKDLGGSMTWQVEESASVLGLMAPAETLNDAVALFADTVRRPAYSHKDWQVAVAETLDELAWREGDLPDVAERVSLAALFPTRHGEAAIDRSIESVSGIGREETAALHPRIYAPETTGFVSIGPAPVGEVVSILERHFGGWIAEDALLRQVVLRPAEFPASTRLLFVPEPGATQAAIHLVRSAPGFDEPGRQAAAAVFRILAADFLSRINSVIREEKGYSYGTAGDMFDVSRGGAITVSTSVGLENAGEALADIFAGFASLATEPIRADELERTITAYRTGLAGIAETAGGLFDDIVNQAGAATTLADSYVRRVAATRLTLDEVRRQAVAMAPLDRAVIVVVADPSVLPQLEVLGYDVEVVPRAARAAGRQPVPA